MNNLNDNEEIDLPLNFSANDNLVDEQRCEIEIIFNETDADPLIWPINLIC